MQTLEPLLNRRVVLPRATETELRVNLELGPGWGILVKQLDILQDATVSTTGSLLAGLATDPDLPNPATSTAWIAEERIPLQKLQVFDASAAGRVIERNLQIALPVPKPGLVLVHDYQVMMRVTAGANVGVAFTVWYKHIELNLTEWVYYTSRRRTGGI